VSTRKIGAFEVEEKLLIFNTEQLLSLHNSILEEYSIAMNQSLSNTNKNSTVLNSLILDEPEPNSHQKDQKVLSQKSSDSSLVKSEDEEFEPESIEESSQSDSKGGVGEQQTFEKTEGDSDAISEIDKNSLEDLQSSRILDESLNQFCLNLNQ